VEAHTLRSDRQAPDPRHQLLIAN